METRRKAAVGALALAAALAVTGTWAYTNFVQKAVNDFDGESTPGVRLHDDFNTDQAAKSEQGSTYDKHVYVENYGEHPQFVRVQLSEYLEKEGTPIITGTTQNQKATWRVHQPTDTELLAPSGDLAHSWWTWALGGQVYYLKTTSTADDAVDSDTAGLTSQDAYKTAFEANTAGYGQTLPADVISMAAWKTAAAGGSAPTNVWVYDLDGWAYWAGPLETGQATGLLLKSVTLTTRPEATKFYYAINVKLQAATLEDIDKFDSTAENGGGGMTDDAKALLAHYAPEKPYIKANMGTVTQHVTAGVTFSLDLNDVFADLNYGDALTFDLVDPPAGASLVGSTLTYTPTEGETLPVIQVQATDSTGLKSDIALVQMTFDAAPAPTPSVSASAEPSESASTEPSQSPSAEG